MLVFRHHIDIVSDVIGGFSIQIGSPADDVSYHGYPAAMVAPNIDRGKGYVVVIVAVLIEPIIADLGVLRVAQLIVVITIVITG